MKVKEMIKLLKMMVGEFHVQEAAIGSSNIPRSPEQ